MPRNAQKDNGAVVLTDEILAVLENGGAALLHLSLAEICYSSYNPRRQKGFDPESMRELADSIAKDGLLKNLVVRQIQDKDDPSITVFEMVAGERRTRALNSLIAEDREVWNPKTGGMSPASEVYATVPCLVQGKCDDKRAIRLAWIENDRHVPLCDADVIDLCQTLESQGLERKEIKGLLDKSEAWLSHTFNFARKLTPQNYERLRAGEINRSVAVKLMEYEAEVQSPVIEAATAIATERYDALKAKSQHDAERAQENLAEVFREHQEAISKKSDAKVVDKAAKKVTAAEKTVQKTVARKNQVEAAGPVISQSDVAEGAYRAGVDPAGNRNLNSAQIREHFVEPCSVLLAIADDGDPLDTGTGNLFPRHLVEYTKIIANGIATGKRDFAGMLRQFCQSSGIWDAKGKPVGFDLVKKTRDEDLDGGEDEGDDEDEMDLDDLGIDLDDDGDVVCVGASSMALDLSGLGDDDDE